MRKIMFLLLWLPLFSFSGPGAETFLPVGHCSFGGLTQFTAHSTKMLEQVSPNYKAYPLTLSVALALEPQLAGFDFSQPAAIYFYRPVQPHRQTPLWCLCVRRTEAKPQPQLTIAKKQLHVKYFARIALISDNRKLLETLTAPPDLPEKMAHDVQIELLPAAATFITPTNLQQLYELAGKKMSRHPAAPGVEILTPISAHLRRLLGQTEKTVISLDILSDQIQLQWQWFPVSGSPLKSFLERQNRNSRLLPQPESGKNFALSFNLLLSPPEHRVLAALLSLGPKTGNDTTAQDFSRLLHGIFANSNGLGRLAVTAASQRQPGQFCVEFRCSNSAAIAPIRQIMATTPHFKSPAPNLYLLYSLPTAADGETTGKLFGALKNEMVYLIGGKITAAAAMKTIAAAASSWPHLKQPGMIFGRAEIDGQPAWTVAVTCQPELRAEVKLLPPLWRKLLPPHQKEEKHRVKLSLPLPIK
ncbi:MAG: hypothetical protein PHQ27_00510 [Victivallales bacterium]|nr:hypothetical protein [Victivallales bacterium]